MTATADEAKQQPRFSCRSWFHFMWLGAGLAVLAVLPAMARVVLGGDELEALVPWRGLIENYLPLPLVLIAIPLVGSAIGAAVGALWQRFDRDQYLSQSMLWAWRHPVWRWIGLAAVLLILVGVIWPDWPYRIVPILVLHWLGLVLTLWLYQAKTASADAQQDRPWRIQVGLQAVALCALVFVPIHDILAAFLDFGIQLLVIFMVMRQQTLRECWRSRRSVRLDWLGASVAARLMLGFLIAPLLVWTLSLQVWLIYEEPTLAASGIIEFWSMRDALVLPVLLGLGVTLTVFDATVQARLAWLMGVAHVDGSGHDPSTRPQPVISRF